MISKEIRAECEADLDFIFDELEKRRKANETIEGARTLVHEAKNPIAEVLSKVRHHASGREFQCGVEATKRFLKIARRLIEDRQESSDWDANVLADSLKQTLLTHLFREDVTNPAQIVDSWLEASLKSVRSQHRKFTHYIPCVALRIGQQDSYAYGPIIFKRKHRIFKEIEEGLANYEKARTKLTDRAYRNALPSQKSCLDNRLPSAKLRTAAETLQEYTEGVDWIAVVSVDRCDHKTSEQRAEAALRIALNSAALFLKQDKGAELRIVGDPFESWRTEKLSSTGRSMFRPSSSWRWSHAEVEEGWSEYLDSVAGPLVATTHELIKMTLAGSALPYRFQVALRAMTWYADAIRDSNYETCLLKCATAVECMVLPRDGKATSSFVIRGSLLAQRAGLDIVQCAETAAKIYSERSAIVHGNLQEIRSSRTERSSFLEFTRYAVLQFLSICSQFRRIETRDDLEGFYSQLELQFAAGVKEIQDHKLDRRRKIHS